MWSHICLVLSLLHTGKHFKAQPKLTCGHANFQAFFFSKYSVKYSLCVYRSQGGLDKLREFGTKRLNLWSRSPKNAQVRLLKPHCCKLNLRTRGCIFYRMRPFGITMFRCTRGRWFETNPPHSSGCLALMYFYLYLLYFMHILHFDCDTKVFLVLVIAYPVITWMLFKFCNWEQ